MNLCKATALSATAIAMTTAAYAESLPAETMVPIKVLVMVKETAREGPKPFADVGGIVIRRNRDEFKNASCPDSSDEKGELTCRLKCMKDDPNLRLQVVAPLKNQAPIVAGMSPPAAETISVENCVVKVDSSARPPLAPIRLVYRTSLAMAQELRIVAPEIYNAVVSGTDGSRVQFTLFKDAAPALQQLARNPGNRRKLQQLAELSEVYEDAVRAGRKEPLSPSLMAYGAGAKSIVLQAVVNDVMGREAGNLVQVSPSFEEFDRSVNNVTKALHEKRVLSEGEIALSQAVGDMKGSKQESPVLGVLGGENSDVKRMQRLLEGMFGK